MKKLVMNKISKLAAVAVSGALALGMLAGCASNNGVNQGQAENTNIQDIQEQINNEVAEGMLSISIASIIEFENGSSEGYANIENVPENRYDMQVTITLDATGEQVYQSDLLEPGTTVEYITLDKVLEKGQYPATAQFVAYDRETGNEEGQANGLIEIDVLN